MSSPDTTTGANTLTHSRMALFSKCRRRYYFAYVLALRPDRESAALRTGISFHEGLDLLAQGKPAEDVLMEVAERYDVCPSWSTQHEWDCEKQVVLRLLAGYAWYWAAHAPIEMVATELPFSVPVVNPETGAPTPVWKRGGVIDKIAKLSDGRGAIVEHKTKSGTVDSNDDYWRRLRFDNQISGYVDAARTLGHDVQTVVYDVIRKPTLRPSQIPLIDEDGFKITIDERTGDRVYLANGKPRQSGDKEKGWILQNRIETPEEYGERVMADIVAAPDTYYARHEVARTDTDIDEFRAELWETQLAMRQAHKTNQFYKNTSACLFGGKCPYFELCYNNWKPGGAEGDVPIGFTKIDHIHPEIERATERTMTE